MSSRPSWEGFLKFNLLAVPVKAYNAAISGGGKIGFHLLHEKCHSRIRYKKVCPIHGEVENSEIVSGYEHSKGQYTVVPKKEREELELEDDKAIAIETFIPADALDPIYYSGRTYYLVPSNQVAQKPYTVLQEAMDRHKRFAVAQIVLSGRGQVAVVRPLGRLLTLGILSYEDQLKSPSTFEDQVQEGGVSAEERQLAEKLIEAATSSEFDASHYRDDYAAKLIKLITSRRPARKRRVDAAEEPVIINLMDALRKSLSKAQGSGGKTSGRKKHVRKPSRGTRRRRTG